MEGGYKKLEIYNLAHSLALKVHKLTMSLPKFEMYEEGGQIRRSSKSVSAQIVEGYALRRYKNEFLHYLWRAYGSSEETLEHLYFLFETESVERTFETPAFLKEPSTEYQADSTVNDDPAEPPNLESPYRNPEP
jgi:four helix bundle protein